MILLLDLFKSMATRFNIPVIQEFVFHMMLLFMKNSQQHTQIDHDFFDK